VRSLGGEPVLPVLLRRGIFPISATSSIAASPAIAATTPLPITSSRSTLAARSAASRRRSSASSNSVPPLSPSSSISSNITTGAAIASPTLAATPSKLCSPPPAIFPPPPRAVEVFVAQNSDRSRPSRPARIGLKPSSSRTTTSGRITSTRADHEGLLVPHPDSAHTTQCIYPTQRAAARCANGGGAGRG
jgi:hypothetical protein